MADNVGSFGGITLLDIPPERVLTAAIDAGVEDVVVVGWKDRKLHFAASMPELGEVLILLEAAKRDVMSRIPA